MNAPLDDAQAAALWRKVEKLLRVEVEHREHWRTTTESKTKRTEEMVEEWSWQVDVHPDYSWKLYGSTTDKSKVPTLAEIISSVEIE